MLRRPPRSTRTATLCPYATLSRSGVALRDRAAGDEAVGIEPIGNHVGCYRIAHTHLRRLFCAIPCPHQPTDVNDPQQKNEQQRQHKRDFGSRGRPRIPSKGGEPALHIPCTVASDSETKFRVEQIGRESRRERVWTEVWTSVVGGTL